MPALIAALFQSFAPQLAGALVGKASDAAMGFVAKKLGVPQEQVAQTLQGMTADQIVQLHGIDVEFQKFAMDNNIKIDLAQIGVNNEEAKSESLFVAGWRPAVGWICGAGLAYAAIVLPVLEFFSKVVFKYTGTFPVIDWALLSNVLIGMLGLGAMRSYDKKNGNSNGH